jgi:rRNA-processing protein CGR1
MEGPVTTHHHNHDILLISFISRRSHLSQGVKTTNWQDRMEKAKKAQAVKKLEQELKDEKQAELQR